MQCMMYGPKSVHSDRLRQAMAVADPGIADGWGVTFIFFTRHGGTKKKKKKRTKKHNYVDYF